MELNESASEIIKRYERTLRADDRDAFHATLDVIDSLLRYCQGGGLVERGNSNFIVLHWYTRLAAALTDFFTRPSTVLDKAKLRELIKRKQTIVYIFCASGYRSTTHLIALCGEERDGKVTLSGAKAIVLLALLSIEDVTEELMTLALRQAPDIFLQLLLGWLNQRAVLTERGEGNRQRLIEESKNAAAAEIEDEDIHLVVNAWMYCSYAAFPAKHGLKKVLNALLLKRMKSAGIHPVVRPPRATSRPKMLVIHERFMSRHAMYRCWAPSIHALAADFELLALADESNIDEPAEKIFSKVYKLPKKIPAIADVVKVVEDIAPDIIFYPSIGMSHWTIMLAGLRLAPLQLMAHGHPATSMWETIDFAYVNDLQGDPASLHSERLLIGNNTAVFEPHSDLPLELPKLVSASTREVRIAVNSKVMKLSHRLIGICRRLKEEADLPVTFSFFPGERHLFFDGLVAALDSVLPNVKVVPYVEYPQFLEEMAKCDLALAAFPFGNTNSTVDTCLLGLPSVVHFGPEGPAQSDRLVLQTMGYPSWLICDSDEQYFETALRLINDPTLREAFKRDIDPAASRAKIFNNSQNAEANPFADMVKYAFRNRDAMISSGTRIFHYSEVLSQNDTRH